LKTLYSISAIEKVLNSSGSKPVVVWCNDINYYVCKYGKVNDLLNEYLGASFCRIWNIPVPDFYFVKVKPEHIPDGFSKRQFDTTCYGCLYLEYAKDVNEYLTTWKTSSYELNKITNKDDLLKIGLFDLWLSNEDRNHNNANLLINPTKTGYSIVAIDHVNIFNTSSLRHGIYQLNEFESIISTDYVKLLFKRGDKLNDLTNSLEKFFYVCVRKCLKNLKVILSKVPQDWNIDVVNIEALLRNQLFSEEWKKQTIQSFRLFLEKQLLKE
jgi:hypothetical protein